MATTPLISTQQAARTTLRLAALAGVLAGIALLLVAAAGTGAGTLGRYQAGYEARAFDEYLRHQGRDTVSEREQAPDALEAAFTRESYRPGERATLRFWTAARDVSLQVFRVGPERMRTVGNDEMRGVPVTTTSHLVSVRSGSTVSMAVERWHTGLYFARLTAGRRVGYAPFVVAPGRLGTHRVAVVMPTHTWQAYNFRDDNGDGRGDTWYADFKVRTARLARPYLNHGVPPHFRSYDLHFLHWLSRTGRDVDVLAQEDLDEVGDGRRLASAYELIVFPGHHEYVTRMEYDAVEQYRDSGGNLLFLSANNFFWRIDLTGDVMTKVAQWRDLGRPEASILGVQYIGNDEGQHRGGWIVRSDAHARWLFAGTGSNVGERFSNAGIEIDHTNRHSPPETHVVAEIPNLLGPGMTAQMTYYETRDGAKVFAAGAFTLAGSIRQRPVARLLENLWTELASPPSERRATAARTATGQAASYGWPVKPFFRQHPVRGFFGDPRIGMTAKGMTKTFHFGIDITCPNGTPVYATMGGTVRLVSFRPETVAVRSDDGTTELQYWHIRPAVRDGQRVVAYETVVGHVTPPWAHVHFAELRGGRYVNPLRSEGIGGFADTTRPTVRSLLVERAGVPLGRRAPTGRVDLVVEASDATPLPTPAPWTGKPVAPAVLRWRILDSAGAVRVGWRTAVDFRLHLPPDAAWGSVYARWTRQNKANRIGRYRFFLAHDLDAVLLRDAVVEVTATDTRGNVRRVRFGPGRTLLAARAHEEP